MLAIKFGTFLHQMLNNKSIFNNNNNKKISLKKTPALIVKNLGSTRKGLNRLLCLSAIHRASLLGFFAICRPLAPATCRREANGNSARKLKKRCEKHDHDDDFRDPVEFDKRRA